MGLEAAVLGKVVDRFVRKQQAGPVLPVLRWLVCEMKVLGGLV
jgi:hypothetical protein